MDLYSLLQMLFRHRLVIIVITISTMISAGAIAFLQPRQYQTTLLYSTGVSEATNTPDSFDVTKFADDFANTISGWLRSPEFTKRLSELASASVSISGESQAKQNLLVNLTYSDQGAADRISTLTQKMLSEEITKYNKDSKFKFFITLHGEARSMTNSSLLLILLAAGLGGFLLGSFWIIFKATLGGKVSSLSAAEQLLGVTAAVSFYSAKSPAVNFLETLLKKIGNNAFMMGADVSLGEIVAELKGNPKHAQLPAEANLLTKSEAKPIIVVKLDTTKITTLRQIRALAEKELHLVVWGEL